MIAASSLCALSRSGCPSVATARGRSHDISDRNSKMEAGLKKNPGIETLRKLAKALGVPVKELLG
jgi:pyrroloquinoline quinone (PQQ) biosynthesis protein C